jgi:NAD(P)-dependent dehydrogenase (short-subunit alcohol dehydrogenase family)
VRERRGGAGVGAPIEPQASERAGEPDAVGLAVAHLCPDRAAFVTGAAIPADGGHGPDEDQVLY